LDVETVFEDAVEDGISDQVVIVGLGRDIHRPRAKILAAGAACLIFSVVDVEEGHLLVGQRVDTPVEVAFAVAAFTAVRAGMSLGGTTNDANVRHEHGLCSWGYGGNVP
jgi:hypothetical protein